MSPFNQQPNQTLAKAIAVLEAFSNGQQERGIRELSRELDINPATVYRLVATLVNAGYLEQNADTQRYFLGPRVLHLASAYSRHNPVSAVARRVFDSYTDRFEHNFYLGRLSQFDVVYVTVLDGRGPIRIEVDAGGRAALHATATGKLLLAHKGDDFIHQFLNIREMKRYTPRTITERGPFWEQIRQIREQGFAINVGELFEDIGAVAVPVHDIHNSEVLGICLAYPLHMVTQKRLEIESLVSLAREISQEISVRCEGLQPK